MLAVIKYLFLTLIFMLSTLFANAQKRSSDKIYWLALNKYTLALDSNYHSTEKEIYLQKPDYVDSIPPKVNGYNIILITGKNQKRLYRAHNNRLIHTIISPITVEDSLLYITITPYSGTLKGNRHYYLGLSGGTTIYFKFDCTKKQFIIDKINNWGI